MGMRRTTAVMNCTVFVVFLAAMALCSAWQKSFWINVLCCVVRVEIQIEIWKGSCTTNTDSKAYALMQEWNNIIDIKLILEQSITDTHRSWKSENVLRNRRGTYIEQWPSVLLSFPLSPLAFTQYLALG